MTAIKKGNGPNEWCNARPRCGAGSFTALGAFITLLPSGLIAVSVISPTDDEITAGLA